MDTKLANGNLIQNVTLVDQTGIPVSGTSGGSSSGAQQVNTLAQPAVARQLSAAVSGGASANTALTTTTRRISITARLADIRYAVGTGAQTASATSHFIAMGERLDILVPLLANIAVLSASASIVGVLEVSELL